MTAERPQLQRELRDIQGKLAKTESPDKIKSRLDRLERKLTQSIVRRKKKEAGLPRFDYPGELPISKRKDEIVHTIRRNQVVIIAGETGSGKSTQIPKMCLEAGRGIRGLIGHTQPRRIAAMTIARRVSEELGEQVGSSVGYKIRFEEKTGSHAYIKVMTDGILLAELQSDPFLNAYDTIIVDEAHERSLNIDFVLGYLRNLLKKRRDLKLIVTSATMDTAKFSKAFNDAPVIQVSGRMYPVELRYRPIDPDLEDSGESNYIDAAIRAVEEIEAESSQGDILIFMPTEQDIRETCASLEGRNKRYAYANDTILPLFARLSWAEQRRIFTSCPSRKIIVATNVAETSITIPGIRYVIDTGLARIAQYNSRTRTLNLSVSGISKSSADQRKGRCGRVEDGVCIRLYDETDYESRVLFTLPEILRSNLAEVILRMLYLRIGDLETFPFIDPPEAKDVRNGLELLKELGAIEESPEQASKISKQKEEADRPAQSDTRPAKGKARFTLTELGIKMACLPIDPRISRMIIEAQKEACVREVSVIAAALSIQDPREWPLEQIEAARKAHEPFQDPSSDFLSFVNIWNRYHENCGILKSQSKIRKFCKAHFISYKRMQEWVDIHGQLHSILAESGTGKRKTAESNSPAGSYASIHKSILSGYLSNIAVRKEKNIYSAARGREVMIFPGSTIFNRGGEWILAAEMVETSRLYARTAAIIDREWLELLGKGLCRSSYSEPHWERKRGEVVASEQVTLFGLVIVPRRSVSYGRISPEEASDIFIRSALVDGDLEKFPRFLEKNRNLIETISSMEDKLRRRDLLVGDEDLFAFYKERLPGIYDIRTLLKRIRESGKDDFLILKEEDILRQVPDEDELSHFPDRISLGKISLPLHYRFNPGSPDDGLTVNVPHGLAGAILPGHADWLVPGLQKEKITSLVKGLPKEYRKRLVPVATTVDIISREMPPGNRPIADALSDFILKRFGLDIPARAWLMEEIPDYLKLRFSITDNKGKEIFSGRDLESLSQKICGDIKSQAFEKAKKEWGRSQIQAWDFGDLPESIFLEGPTGVEGLAYPALEQETDSLENPCCRIRLFKDRNEAEAAHLKGMRILFSIHFKQELQYLKKQNLLKGEEKISAGYFGGEKAVEKATHERALRNIFPDAVRTEQDFRKACERASGTILLKGMEAAQEVIPALNAYSNTRQKIRKMEEVNRANRSALKFLETIRMSMDELLPKQFIMEYANEHLFHIPRYLKALEIRAERGLIHLEKDREKAGQTGIYEELSRRLNKSISPQTSKERLKAIENFRWIVEEYKVAVFAQQIKTAFPVSPKRLEEKYKEIERMT
jgi:ATP-dependent helicase HrpA